jgi:hypothetical protein
VFTLICAVLIFPRPPFAWRVLTVLGIAGLAARPLLQWFWANEMHVEWTADGVWHLRRAGQTLEHAILLNESAILGPWVFLIWSHGGRRYYAIIDSSSLTAVAFSALRSRLRLPDRLRASCDSDHATSVRIGRTPEL